MHLHRTVGHPSGHLRGKDFQHGGLLAHVLAVVEFPGSMVGHQSGGVDVSRGVSDEPLDRLAVS